MCTVQFEPGVWARADYELKRNIVAALGIALAHGSDAEYTEIRNVMTNAELGTYSSRYDRTSVK